MLADTPDLTIQYQQHQSEESKQGKQVRPYDEEQAESENGIPSLLKAGNKIAGLLVMIFLSYHFSSYLYMLHENDMWFSEIMVSINNRSYMLY